MQDTVWTTLIFFLSITVIVCVTVWGRVRRSRLQHETLRVMVEKGVPIPPELLQPPVRRNDLRRGLVWIAVGLGLVLLGLTNPFHLKQGTWALGAIPLLVGTAFLIAWKVDARETKTLAAGGFQTMTPRSLPAPCCTRTARPSTSSCGVINPRCAISFGK